MTKEQLHYPITDLNREITQLLAKFGLSRTLRATIRAYLKVKSRPPDPTHLSDHLRKDVGMGEKRPERKRAGWDARF